MLTKEELVYQGYLPEISVFTPTTAEVVTESVIIRKNKIL